MNLHLQNHLHLLAVSILLHCVSSLSTLSFNFNNTVGSNYIHATYPLGVIPANATLTFTLSAFTPNEDLSNVHVQLLMDISYTLVTEFTCSGQSCSSYYSISPSALDNIYYFRIYLRSTIDILPAAFDPYYLTVKSYPGPFSYLLNPKQSTLLKIMDILRVGINKFIYIQSANTIELGIFPLSAAITSTDSIMRLIRIDVNDGLLSYGNVVPLTNTGFTVLHDYGGSIFGIMKYTAQLAQGYYVLFVTYNYDTPVMQISWQTDTFVCPYSSQYADYFLAYQGCTPNQINSGFPCLVFDTSLMQCRSCYSGYSLSQGQCMYSITCSSREYVHFGQCYPVSALCGTFDLYTGNCLTCSNPINSALINGTCILNSVTCGPRQYSLNQQCYNVSSQCDTFNSSDGSCLSCINSTFFILQNGKCIQKIVNCALNQYVAVLECHDIPHECLNFDTTKKSCNECIKGYFQQNGTCLQVVCPPKTYPSYGNGCVDVSPLCDKYDQATGQCLSCLQAGYLIANGKCLQGVSPLSGCNARQQLGFGFCANASLNCMVYNLITGDCDACLKGYYLDYTGHCSAMIQCGSNFFSFNGECLAFPSNCQQINKIGLCQKCIHSIYRLIEGACIEFTQCASRQYLNPQGQCVDVGENCDSFNPSNGQCITCKDGGNFAFGKCCSTGFIATKNGCISNSTQFDSQGNLSPSFCTLYHPILAYCIQCQAGYSPTFTFFPDCLSI